LKRQVSFGAITLLAVVACARAGAFSLLLSSNYLPHRFCYLAQPGLIWTNVSMDALIAAAYGVIFGCLFWIVGRLKSLSELKAYTWIIVSFGTFILACGVTHAMEVVTVWWPVYRLSAAFKIICAGVSIPTALLFFRATPGLTRNLRQFLETFSRARRQTEDDAANYRGQIEAINRSQMMIELQMDGTILAANENYLCAFGYTTEEVVGKNHSIFTTKADRESAEYRQFWARLREGCFQAGHFCRIGKGGKEVWIEASYNPILGADGTPIKVVKFALNVTDRIKIQSELKDAEERLRAILDNVMDGILTIDGAGAIVSINRAVVKMFGYESGELVGRNLEMLLPEPNRSDPDGYLVRSEATGKTRAIGVGRELEGLTKTGQTFPMELTVTEVFFHGQRMFVGLVRDITERKRADETSRQVRAAAEAANRTKSDFLANMSHEIRTPMNAILGMTYLAMRAAPTPQQHGYLTKIGNAARSLLSIMNGILDFSKIEAGKLELEHIVFSFDEVLSSLLDIVGQRAKEKELALTISVHEEVPEFLVGDPLRLGQILINLVNNAIKFTDKGEIVVAVSPEEMAADHVCLGISVRDTGIGIGPEKIANLFQSFNQIDTSFTRKYGGTGLGLAISKQLCELMHGSISVESVLGKGSTFHVRARFGISATAPSQSLCESEKPVSERSVLVAEDSESDRNVLVAMLQANGFRARGVASGEEALSALAHASQLGEPFDLVLMDWQLPGMDGIEASRRIKVHPTLSRIPAILMISAFECGEVTSGMSHLTFDGFLIKPITEDLLFCTIASVCGERKSSAQEFPSSPSSERSSGLVGRRVLLVEDNEINRDLAIELLGDLGIRVTIAVDGREGVDRIAAEPFDLVLMDIQMPVMDGLTATRLIRSNVRFRGLPIIAMTAHAMHGDRERSLFAGMNDHLTKPISPDALRDMLLRWMPERKAKQPELESAAIPSVLSDEEVPGELLPFDVTAALQRANGKPKLLRKMLRGFHQRYADAVPELQAGIRGGRMGDAHRLAHSLKGVAAMLEAADLANAAAAVEHALREERLENLDLLIDDLEAKLRPALTAAASLEAETLVASSPTTTHVEEARPCLLLVDDESCNVDLLADAFRDDYELLRASEGVTALEIATRKMPDMILLDVLMPGIDGYEVCRRLKREHRTSDIAVIFVTGLTDVVDQTKGLELGAVDYVSKPINSTVVRARVGNQLRLKRAHNEMTRLAATDALTGLANRRRFDEMLAYEYARHVRSGTEFSLILMDIDYFKSFNDNYGHVRGDECLRMVAKVIVGVMSRATDLVARFGGEEFVFLLPETDLNGAFVFAEKIRKSISDLALPHRFSSVADHLTVSLGVISVWQLPGRSISNIVAQADAQLYAAKAGGRNRVCAASAG
jgi:two-component system, sensor histidine kinase and response regulator